jgi:hypothetical protein
VETEDTRLRIVSEVLWQAARERLAVVTGASAQTRAVLYRSRRSFATALSAVVSSARSQKVASLSPICQRWTPGTAATLVGRQWTYTRCVPSGSGPRHSRRPFRPGTIGQSSVSSGCGLGVALA